MLGVVLAERLQREQNERHKAELEALVAVRTRELAASEIRARSMLRTALDGVWLVDSDTCMLEANAAACAMLGYRPEELLGMRVAAIEAGDSGPAIETRGLRLRQDGCDLFESRHRRKDGTVFPVEVSITHLQELDQSVVFIRDITGRKQAEDRLLRSQAMLARTEGIAQVGSWEWDRATDAVTWSDELFRILRRDPAEGAPSYAQHAALYPPDDLARLQQAVAASLNTGQPYELELRALRRDGEARVCLARGVPEPDAEGKVSRMFGSLQDITGQKQAEAACGRARSGSTGPSSSCRWPPPSPPSRKAASWR